MDSDGRLILSSRFPVGDSRLESSRCCSPCGPTDRLLCSVRSRPPSAGVLTVSANRPTFDPATGTGPIGGYTRCCGLSGRPMAAGHVGLGFVPASDSSHSSPRVVADPSETSKASNSSHLGRRSDQSNTPKGGPSSPRDACAQISRRCSGRSMPTIRLETVRARPFGSPSCTPPDGDPLKDRRRRAPCSATNAADTSKPMMTIALSVVSNVPELPSRREGSPRRCSGAAFPFHEFA